MGRFFTWYFTGILPGHMIFQISKFRGLLTRPLQISLVKSPIIHIKFYDSVVHILVTDK